MLNNKTYSLSLRGEFLRKSLHISSSIIPIGYYFLDKFTTLLILIPILIIFLSIELLKYKNNFIFELYKKLFGIMLKEHELNKRQIRLNGASWMLISNVLCILIFPKLIAITSMLLLSLSDTFASVIGKIFAKKHFTPNRSFTGSFTFFLVSLIIALLTPKYLYVFKEYSIYTAMVFITTLVDAVGLPLDDNFTIPIVSSISLYLLYLLIFPDLSLKLF